MQFIDLKTQHRLLQSEVDRRMQAVLAHGQYILGSEVHELEACLAEYVGVKHCVTVSSGTTALQIALMALEIGPGDEVITTPFSFFASASMIACVGATPVFVDIDPHTYTLDARQLEAAITLKTKAILPVSLYGQCADMTAIQQIADRHGLAVVEDAAQSFGATHCGRRSGGLSTIGCTSFFPSKPLGCYGDGGACFTNDDHLAARMRLLMNHGQEVRYHHVILGLNARLDTLQAAVLLAKFSIFPDECVARQAVAAWYAQALPAHIRKPIISPDNVSVFGQYTIEVDARETMQAALQQQGISTAVHYPKLLSDQPALSGLVAKRHYPHSAHAAARVLSLPFGPYLSEVEVRQVASAVAAAIAEPVES